MASQWHVHGEKQGKNVGVIWHFDLESRILVLNFAILSVTQVENSVKEAISLSFGLSVFTPVCEFQLPPSVSAMQFVTAGLAKVDKILAGKQVNHFVFSTVF